jgi:hypothetical protein
MTHRPDCRAGRDLNVLDPRHQIEFASQQFASRIEVDKTPYHKRILCDTAIMKVNVNGCVKTIDAEWIDIYSRIGGTILSLYIGKSYEL